MSLNVANSEFASAGRASSGVGRERFVPPAMLVVAIAMGVAGHLHLGLTPEFAAAVGLSLFCIMLMCHVLLRVADAADRAAEAEEERLAGEVASPLPVPAMPPAPPMNTAPPRPDVGAPQAMPRHQQAGGAAARVRPVAAARAPVSDPEPAVAPGSGLAPGSGVGSSSAAPTGWDYRPVDPRPQIADADQARGTSNSGALRDFAPGSFVPPRDSAHVDAILKRLATQIRGDAAEPSARARAEPALPLPAGAQPAAPVAEVGTADSDRALDQAVDALRSTVEALRNSEAASASASASGSASASSSASASGPGVGAVASALPPVAEARLAAIAEALAAERAKVYLEPILQLAEEQARHFEVSVRIVDANGTDLDARQVSMRAGNAELLGLLDAVGLRHAAGFALKLERRGREGSVFSEIAGQSLADEGFVSDASGRHAQGVADRLVLTFQQSEMRALGPAQLAALGDLSRLGFRFALQGVVDLDMDFESLRDLGLNFVKLDAELFLKGLICGGQEVPASDICRFFDDMGLGVIVSSIDSEVLLQRIAGCGVAFGQGRVFGGPRPIAVGGQVGGIAA